MFVLMCHIDSKDSCQNETSQTIVSFEVIPEFFAVLGFTTTGIFMTNIEIVLLK